MRVHDSYAVLLFMVVARLLVLVVRRCVGGFLRCVNWCRLRVVVGCCGLCAA